MLVHVPKREREGRREREREGERESHRTLCRPGVHPQQERRLQAAGCTTALAHVLESEREREGGRERGWFHVFVHVPQREGGEEREGKSHGILCHPGVHPHQGRRIQVALAPLCSCTFLASLTDSLPLPSSYHY